MKMQVLQIQHSWRIYSLIIGWLAGRETGKSTLKLKNVYRAAPVLLKLFEQLRKDINLSFLLAQQHLICSNSCHTRNFNESFEYKNQTGTVHMWSVSPNGISCHCYKAGVDKEKLPQWTPCPMWVFCSGCTWKQTIIISWDLVSVNPNALCVFWFQGELKLRGQSVLLREEQQMYTDILTSDWICSVRL